jgi:dUTP pyrophosphatase
MLIKVKKLVPAAIIPKYATPGAACFDLHAVIESVPFMKNEVRYTEPWVYSTGLAFEIPVGHVMLIFSRSGHGFNFDTRLANCVGVIDSDYRGEVKVKLTRDPRDELVPTLFFNHGDRIAQAMVLPIEQVSFEEVTELSTTERGEGGFGSTGSGAL